MIQKVLDGTGSEKILTIIKIILRKMEIQDFKEIFSL